jgi:hypothetical protein
MSSTPTQARKINLVRLAHVYYTHKDLANASKFLLDFGLQEIKPDQPETPSPTRTETEIKVIYYHGTSAEPFLYAAESGPENAFGGAAFVVESMEDLEFAARTLPGASPVLDLGREDPGIPGGGFCVTFQYPVDGIPFRLVFGQRMRDVGDEDGEENGLPQLRYNFVCSAFPILFEVEVVLVG